jgi:hypothetical protein
MTGPLLPIDSLRTRLRAQDVAAECGCATSIPSLSIPYLVPQPGRLAQGRIRFARAELG